MKSRGSRALCRWVLLLACLSGLAALPEVLCAGEPIHFSSPKKDVTLPSDKATDIPLPKQKLKLDFRHEDTKVPLIPPVAPVNPFLEKKLKERREESKNWLMNDPEVFRERFTDPFKAGSDLSSDEFKLMGNAAVERVFGKEDKSSRDKLSSKSGNLIYSDQPLFESKKRGELAKTLGSSSASGGLSGDKDDSRSSSESVLKSFFDSRSAADRLPLLPGMSFYQMMDASNARAEKREREQRREEFSRILSPRPAGATGPFDPINGQEDQTRNLINPITPVFSVSPTVPTKPVTPLPEAPLPDRLAPAKLPFGDDFLRVANPGKTVTATPAIPDKTRQLESLKLMSRPSVLTLPGRSF